MVTRRSSRRNVGNSSEAAAASETGTIAASNKKEDRNRKEKSASNPSNSKNEERTLKKMSQELRKCFQYPPNVHAFNQNFIQDFCCKDMLCLLLDQLKKDTPKTEWKECWKNIDSLVEQALISLSSSVDEESEQNSRNRRQSLVNNNNPSSPVDAVQGEDKLSKEDGEECLTKICQILSASLESQSLDFDPISTSILTLADMIFGDTIVNTVLSDMFSLLNETWWIKFGPCRERVIKHSINYLFYQLTSNPNCKKKAGMCRRLWKIHEAFDVPISTLNAGAETEGEVEPGGTNQTSLLEMILVAFESKELVAFADGRKLIAHLFIHPQYRERLVKRLFGQHTRACSKGDCIVIGDVLLSSWKMTIDQANLAPDHLDWFNENVLATVIRKSILVKEKAVQSKYFAMLSEICPSDFPKSYSAAMKRALIAKFKPIFLNYNSVPNANVREAVARVYFLYAPLIDDDLNQIDREEWLMEQCDISKDMMSDMDNGVRAVGVCGVLSMMAVCWQTIPVVFLKRTFTSLSTLHASDPAWEVRLAMYQGLRRLVGNPSSHKVMNALLTKIMKLGINDVNDRVRYAAIKLLFSLTGINTIKMFDMVSAQQLMDRLSVETKAKVAKEIVGILSASYFPVGKGWHEQLSRICVLYDQSEAGLRNMCRYIHHFISPQHSGKIVNVLLTYVVTLVRKYKELNSDGGGIQSSQESDNEENDGDKENVVPGGGSSAETSIESDGMSVNSESFTGSETSARDRNSVTDFALWNALLDAAVIMWTSLSVKLQSGELASVRHSIYRTAAKLTHLAVNIGTERTEEVLMYIGTLLPPSQISYVSKNVLRKLARTKLDSLIDVLDEGSVSDASSSGVDRIRFVTGNKVLSRNYESLLILAATHKFTDLADLIHESIVVALNQPSTSLLLNSTNKSTNEGDVKNSNDRRVKFQRASSTSMLDGGMKAMNTTVALISLNQLLSLPFALQIILTHHSDRLHQLLDDVKLIEECLCNLMDYDPESSCYPSDPWDNMDLTAEDLCLSLKLGFCLRSLYSDVLQQKANEDGGERDENEADDSIEECWLRNRIGDCRHKYLCLIRTEDPAVMATKRYRFAKSIFITSIDIIQHGMALNAVKYCESYADDLMSLIGDALDISHEKSYLMQPTLELMNKYLYWMMYSAEPLRVVDVANNLLIKFIESACQRRLGVMSNQKDLSELSLRMGNPVLDCMLTLTADVPDEVSRPVGDRLIPFITGYMLKTLSKIVQKSDVVENPNDEDYCNPLMVDLMNKCWIGKNGRIAASVCVTLFNINADGGLKTIFHVAASTQLLMMLRRANVTLDLLTETTEEVLKRLKELMPDETERSESDVYKQSFQLIQIMLSSAPSSAASSGSAPGSRRSSRSSSAANHNADSGNKAPQPLTAKRKMSEHLPSASPSLSNICTGREEAGQTLRDFDPNADTTLVQPSPMET